MLPVLVFLALAFFFVSDWLSVGPYDTIRDGRIYGNVLRSVAFSVMVIGLLAVLRGVVMLVILTAWVRGWHWVLGLPFVSRPGRCGWFSEPDQSVKGVKS